MWKIQNWGLFVIILGPFFIFGTLMILASQDIVDPLGMHVESSSKELLIGGILCFVGPSLAMGGILFFLYLQNKRIMYLVQNGVQGHAILKGIEQTGVEINNVPQFRMRLEVHLPDRPVYELIHKECLNVLVTNSIKKDMKIPCFVHPENSQNILLSWQETSETNYPNF